jgi:hypothetical protein
VLKTKHRARIKLTLKSETIQHLDASQLQYINGALMNSPEPECSLRTAFVSYPSCPTYGPATC